MAQTMWPTHKAKARQAKNAKLYRKKRNRKLRKLMRDGKRVILSA